MPDYTENYKGHEIRLTDTGAGWEYQITAVRGYRRPMTYANKEKALEIARGIIDRNTTL
jgi:hypothetical protein